MRISMLFGSTAVMFACSSALAGCAATNGERDGAPVTFDRPGILFSPFLVPPQRAQLELGVPTFSSSSTGGVDVTSLSAGAALRYGLNDDMELRASLPTWSKVRSEADGEVVRSDGFGDVEVGAKWALVADPARPRAALVSLRLPTGADRFSTGDPGAAAYFVEGRDIGGSTWLQGMIGVSHTPFDDAQDATSGAIAAAIARPLGDDAGAYLEVAAFPGLRHVPGQALVGGGITHMPMSQLQVDLWIDIGLDEDAPDLLAGLGLSWRF